MSEDCRGNIKTLFLFLSFVFLLFFVFRGTVSAQAIKALTIERIKPERPVIDAKPGKKVEFKVNAKSTGGWSFPIQKIVFSATEDPEVFGREVDECVFFCGGDDHKVEYKWGDHVWEAEVTATVYSTNDSVLTASVSWTVKVGGTPRIIPEEDESPAEIEITKAEARKIKNTFFHLDPYPAWRPGPNEVTLTVGSRLFFEVEATCEDGIEYIQFWDSPPNHCRWWQDCTTYSAIKERTFNTLGRHAIVVKVKAKDNFIPIETTWILNVVAESPKLPDLIVGVSRVNQDISTIAVLDLSGEHVEVPHTASLAPGDSFQLEATVRNRGSKESRRTILRFYRSSDSNISTSDILLIGMGSVVRVLKVGEEIKITPSKHFTVPTVPGVYYYGACVDSINNESDVDNNCSDAIAITVPASGPPVLVVESVSVDKTTLAPGEGFRLDTTIRNQGNARSSLTTLRFYRSSDPNISLNDTQLHEQTVHRISVREQITPWKQFTAPEVPGIYYYGVCVDRADNEPAIDNNCSEAIQITVKTSDVPDLVVESLTPSKTTLAPGESFTLTATVQNIGTARSQSGVLSYYKDLGEAGKRNIRRLVPNQTSKIIIELKAPEEPGVYYYDACVSQVRDEVNKDNNCSTRIAITIGIPVNQVPIVSDPIPDVPVANQAPVTVGVIPDQTLSTNGSAIRLDLSNYFRAADGDTLTYTATSDNPNVAFLQVVGTSVSILPLNIIGRANVRVTASDGNLTVTQDFIVVVQQPQGEQPVNRAPVTVGLIPNQTLPLNANVVRLDLSDYFRDADGDTLTYTTTSDNASIALLQTVKSSLSIYPLQTGRANVRVMASDGNLAATQDFIVLVQQPEKEQPTNQPPSAIGTIDPQTLTVSGGAQRVDVSSHFRDSDGDSLTYTARSDDTNVVTVRVSRSQVTITPQGAGSTTLHVTASDGSLEATQSISVTVAAAPPVVEPTSFDLAIQSITVSKNTLSPGESFTLSVTIHNKGPGTSGVASLSYYYSLIQGRTPEDQIHREGTVSLASLASGANTTKSFRLNAPSTPKAYYYGAWLSGTTNDMNLYNDVATEVGVTVHPPPEQPQNQAPVASGSIPAQTLTVGAAAAVQVSGYFSDPDGDSLTYTARSDATSVATVQISGDLLTITPLRAGRATITVTASDGGLTATHRFTATVQSASFGVGDRIIVQNSSGGGLNGLLVRNGAGTGFTHVISVFNGATGTITEGPESANGYTWWKVSWDRSDQVFCDVNPCVGWVFESFRGTRVIAENNASPVTTPQPIQAPPDLVIESVRVSDDTLAPRESFKFYATVRNQGAGEASRTTLRYYRSSDATISTSDTEVDTDSVISLDPNESDEEWDSLRAPSEPGIYYYGVCVDSVTDESSTNNNCATSIRITVAASLPDLVIESVRVSDDTIEVGERFTFYATVRNQGNREARRATLRYYRSSDSNISERDTEEGTDSVSSLDADETSEERVTITAPNQSGTYYYGVCVDNVTDESNTNNNCATGIRVTVADAIIVRPPPGLGVGDSIVVQNASGGGLNGLIVRAGAGTGFAHIISVFNGATGTITDGPESANGYTWWKVRWDRSDQVFCDVNPCVGWVFEFFQGTRVIAEDDAFAAPALHAVTPTETVLLSNYPNPFNPETWIPYQLSEPVDVSVSIYSVNGHLVRRLDLGHRSAGVYRSRGRAAYWDGRSAFGERVASGLYFYTLTAGDFTATRKMLIQK